jgi:hypothetical protein
MKFYGSISQLVSVVFRKNSNDITLEPNQAITYTAGRVIQTPPQDAASILVSENATQTLTGKTMSGASNTFSAISLTASVTGVLPVANGGTNSSAALSNNRVIQSSGGAVVEAAAITAARALISDANGIPTQSVTTSAELAFVNGVTSAIQTQIDSKVAKAGDTMSGNLVMANQKEVRFSELTANGTNFASFKAAASMAGDTPYTLPDAYPASSGSVLASTTGGVMSWAASTPVTSFKADWIAADGATKSITHSLGSTDVMVQIFDEDDGRSLEVDIVQRTDANTLDLTASEAPAVSWRVLILKV